MIPLTATVEETTGSDFGPGLLGFLVVAFLGVSLFVLYRSMRKQMRKVDFDPEATTDEERMGDGGSS